VHADTRMKGIADIASIDDSRFVNRDKIACSC